jgi:hypothetical protein
MSAGPIFIGGLMKSGTTLLRAMLGRHPGLFGGLETHWFTADFAQGWRDARSPSITRLLAFFDMDEADHEAVAAGAGDAAGYLDAFMARCAARAGKPRWVEKTPGNVLHLDAIAARWPGARVLHMIRDPRDVYASWKKSHKYDLDRFLADAAAIERALGDRLGTSDAGYLEVHYEDLVRAPRAAMEAVLAFAGEPWADGIDDYQGTAGEYEKVERVTGKASPTLASVARPIFQDGVGQWRAVLTAEEVAAIESRLGDYAARTGAYR